MNSKAIKRQLLAAIAMVLVAAIALGSSTYAWFANNNKVSATGMSVKATAEGGIEIKAVSSTRTGDITDSWSTLANANMQNGLTLYPTSHNPSSANNGVLTNDWFHASAMKAAAYGAKDDTYAKLQTVDGECTFTNGVAQGNGVLAYEAGKSGALVAGSYYLATTYNIASVGTSATDLKVAGVTVTSTTTNNAAFNKSLRVAVVCGSNVALYAPLYDVATSYTVCTNTAGNPITTSTATSTAQITNALPGTQESGIIAGSVGTETNATVVNVYIWFEGEDTNHYTNNLDAKADDLSVTVDFTATVA